MNEYSLYLKQHPKIPKKIFLVGYIIFAGCVAFPFDNELFPFDFEKVYLLITSYGIIGVGFAGVYGRHKGKFVYITSLILTGIGLICRYVIEYGEVSNTLNFTPFNIVSYLIIIPIFTTVTYQIIAKYLTNICR